MDATGFGWHESDVPPDSAEMASTMAPYYLYCIETFGAKRCMFENNFPPNGLKESSRATFCLKKGLNGMKRIAMEEHFFTRDYEGYLRTRTENPKRKLVEDSSGTTEYIWYSDRCTGVIHGTELSDKLNDLGEGRLAAMDKAGIDIQVLSLSAPGVEAFRVEDGIYWARQTNDHLTAAIRQHPDRFVGLAALPMQSPEAAATELERAVKAGLKGAKVNSHVKGEYLDNPKYWVVLKTAEKLDVPIYIHPREPSPDIEKPFGDYPGLWSALWGFGADVGLHSVRLICSGVFDKYPGLKIVLGHMGEALPFWRWRLDNHWPRSPLASKMALTPGEYLQRNFYMATSGMFFEPALMCAMNSVGVDNIMFAVDYPHEDNEVAVKFMDAAGISPRDREKIYHLNAEKLLNL